MHFVAKNGELFLDYVIIAYIGFTSVDPLYEAPSELVEFRAAVSAFPLDELPLGLESPPEVHRDGRKYFVCFLVLGLGIFLRHDTLLSRQRGESDPSTFDVEKNVCLLPLDFIFVPHPWSGCQNWRRLMA